MDTNNIFNILKEFTGISIRETNKTIVGSGSITKAYCLTHMTGDQYSEFYNKAKNPLNPFHGNQKW